MKVEMRPDISIPPSSMSAAFHCLLGIANCPDVQCQDQDVQILAARRVLANRLDDVLRPDSVLIGQVMLHT